MVTTSYVDFTAGLNTIPDRTDNTGTGINDLSGREEPLPNRLLDRGGTLTPANAFVPAKGTGDFDVDLGSGTADQDLYVVESDVTGQAPFIIRLEDTNATVTLDAADADDRWDQVFLVVRDATEDGNSDGQTLARLSYRKGDSGTSPSKPGADSEWVHSELIASILVPGGATSISNSDITDERVDSSLLQKLFDESVRRTAASVFGSVLDSRYSADPHGSGDHDSTVSDNPHGSGDHDTSVSDNPHGSGDHDSSVSDNPHGQADHDSTVPRIATATYTGDGTSNRQIDVGFTPTYVAITSDGTTDEGGFTTSQTNGVRLGPSNSVNITDTFHIVTNGFEVGTYLNENSNDYVYTAFA